MRKISMFLLLALLVASAPCFASVGVKSEGTSKGTATDINFVGATVSNDGSTATITPGLHVYQASLRTASGATAGTMLAISNANNQGDCGATGGGTTFVVCVSDGTNWKSLRSTNAA